MNTIPASRMHAALLERAYAALGERRAPEPTFPLRVGWADSYEDVFSDQFTADAEAEQVLVASDSAHRRLMITGKGGSGKSVLLSRLARNALETEELPVLIDLANWTVADNRFWLEHRKDKSEVFQFLLRRFARPSISAYELNLASGPTSSLLMIDGLSEVDAHLGDAVLAAVNDALIALPGARVVVADRLVRREVDLERWRLAVVLPLSSKAVRYVLEGYPAALERYNQASEQQRDLFRSPYFLNRLIRGEAELEASRSAEQYRWFSEHASLTESEIDETAAAAFRFYHESSSRTFRLESFREVVPEQTIDKLKAAGALKLDGPPGFAYFDHQLKHDYLAARHLAFSADLWNRNSFDTVTLHANSFDVLGLVLEQVPGLGDDLVRRVYDWNPYGAAYVVAENRSRNLGKITRAMEMVIEAVTAERRFHLMIRTRQQAEDALRVIQTVEASRMLSVSNLQELIDLVRGADVPEAGWFEEWKQVFTRKSAAEPDEQDLKTVREEDSILGWTYANVAKRLAVSAAQQELLRKWAEDATMEVWWRIVHILGAFPTRLNADFLLGALDRPGAEWRWIRYGSMRSLVEIAARAEERVVREYVMTELAVRADALLPDRFTVKAFERAVAIIPETAPEGWVADVKVVLVELYKAAKERTEKDRWLALADQLERLYPSDDGIGRGE